MERIIQLTADGSHTVAIPEMQVTYHSKHGAIQESRHVFLQEGLHALLPAGITELRILEMGFGTGLNALLTAMEADAHQVSVLYHSVEAYPLLPEQYEALAYGSSLQKQDWFTRMHQSPWGEMLEIHSYFKLYKEQTTLNHFLQQPINGVAGFHLVYFDAFAPTAQPELWTESVFRGLFDQMIPGGLLVTYCSKGVVRRAMQAAGFTVEKRPGPPGKREMVRAWKSL